MWTFFLHLWRKWVMRCWCGYLSGLKCRLSAYGPADATAIREHHHLLRHLNSDWFSFSGTGLYPSCPGKETVKRFVFCLCLVVHNLFLQLCSSLRDFDWHNASRGPSAVAELRVFIRPVYFPDACGTYGNCNTRGDSGVISFHIYASRFSTPSCR